MRKNELIKLLKSIEGNPVVHITDSIMGSFELKEVGITSIEGQNEVEPIIILDSEYPHQSKNKDTMTPEEFYYQDETRFGYFTKLSRTGINSDYEKVFAFAKAYHQQEMERKIAELENEEEINSSEESFYKGEPDELSSNWLSGVKWALEKLREGNE